MPTMFNDGGKGSGTSEAGAYIHPLFSSNHLGG
jgi:hypothetical protein